MSVPKSGPPDVPQSGSSSGPPVAPSPQTSPPSSPVHASYDSSSDTSTSSVAEQAKGVFSSVLSSDSSTLSSTITPTSAAAAAAAATHSAAMAVMSSSSSPLAYSENDQVKFEAEISTPEGLAALSSKSAPEILRDMQRIQGLDCSEVVANYLIAHLDPQKAAVLVKLCVAQEPPSTFLRGETAMVMFVKKQRCLLPLSDSLQLLAKKIIAESPSLKASNSKGMEKAVLSAMDGIIKCVEQNSSFDILNLTGAIRKARKGDAGRQVISLVVLRLFQIANLAAELNSPNSAAFSLLQKIIMCEVGGWDEKVRADLEVFKRDASFRKKLQVKSGKLEGLL